MGPSLGRAEGLALTVVRGDVTRLDVRRRPTMPEPKGSASGPRARAALPWECGRKADAGAVVVVVAAAAAPGGQRGDNGHLRP